MLKKFLILLSLFYILPVCAGELENAIENNNNVFLYIYTEPCRYCKLFSPRYDRLIQKHKNDFKFVKIDADTEYGREVSHQLQVQYLPFVLLINKNRTELVRPSCLLDDICTENQVKSFLK